MTETDQPLDQTEPQDNEDFDQAFDAYASGEQPSSDEPEQPVTEPEASEDPGAEEDTATSEPAEDLASRLQALEAENERLRHSEASQRGRLGAYQRQINALQRQVQQTETPTSGTEKSDDQQRQEAADAAGVEDWEALKSEFPEVAKALDARLAAESQQRAADRQRQAQLEARIAELQSAVEPIQQQAQEQHLKSQEDALHARHPDWREVVAAPSFAEWLNRQPQSLQALAESTDAAEAAALVDLYKSQAPVPGSRTDQPDKRQERLAAAQSVPRRGATPRSGVPEDFEAAFDHYAERGSAR